MKLGALVKEIAKQEGKKHEASVGDVREIIGIISDIWFNQVSSGETGVDDVSITLLENGKKRAKKKKS